MNTFKRFLVCFLALLTVSSVFTACSDATADETEETTQATPGAETAEGEETEIKYADMIQAADYNGWTLNIANDGLNPEYFSSFTVEDLTGDAFNDSIYERNSRIMEKFNINMDENYNGSVGLIKNSVTAGTHDVGFGQVLHQDCMGLISQGYVHPINTMPVFDLSKPYWDKGAQETLMLDGLLWYGYCTLGFDLYEGMAMMFYNGFLLEDAGVTITPSDLYYEGKWTLEAMYNMMNQVVRDANGDGKMTSDGDDVFGWSGREFEYLPSLYSSGLSLLLYDEANDTFVMNVMDENVMAVGDWLNKIINDTSLSLPGRNDTTRNLFKEGRSLFYSRLLGDFRNLRDKEDDYGIICYPSLNEGEIVSVYVQNPFAIMIPSDVENETRLGTVMEAMIADTFDNVMDPYVEKAIIGKGTRDEESATLFLELCEKRVYDMSYALGEFGAINAYNGGLKTNTYASFQKRLSKSFGKSIATIMEKLDDVGSYYK